MNNKKNTVHTKNIYLFILGRGKRHIHTEFNLQMYRDTHIHAYQELLKLSFQMNECVCIYARLSGLHIFVYEKKNFNLIHMHAAYRG